MSTETDLEYLLRRLDEAKGLHNQIAKETGVGQSTLSRIFLRQAVPLLTTAGPLLDWFDAYDRKQRRLKKGQPGSASAVLPGQALQRRRGRVGHAAAPAASK